MGVARVEASTELMRSCRAGCLAAAAGEVPRGGAATGGKIAEAAETHRRFATGRKDLRRGERLQFLGVAVTARRAGVRSRRRMKVDLAHSLRQMPDDAGEPCAGHLSRPAQPEGALRHEQTGPRKSSP